MMMVVDISKEAVDKLALRVIDWGCGDGSEVAAATLRAQAARIEQLEVSVQEAAQEYVDAALAYQSTPNDRGGSRGPKGQAMSRKTQAFSELQIALSEKPHE